MREIYGEGLLKLLDSSLRGHPRPIPIEAYWFINHKNVEAFILERPGVVTFLIATPKPYDTTSQTDDKTAQPEDLESQEKTKAKTARDAWVTTKSTRQFQFQVDPTRLDPDVRINKKNNTNETPTDDPVVRTYKVGGFVGPQ